MHGCIYSVLPRYDGLVDAICADAKEQDMCPNAGSDADRRAVGEFLRFGHHAVGRDRGDLVGTEFCEQQVIRVPRPDDRGRGRRGENCDVERRSDSGDLWREGARDPEVAIWPRGDGGRSAHSGKLGNDAVGGDSAELVHCLFGEPHVPIGASRNVARKGIGCGRLEFSKRAGRDLETPDGMIGLVGKPDVAIGAGGDAHADPEKGELIFRYDSIRRNRSNLARRTFAEPDVAVWPGRDKCRIAQAWGPGVVDHALRSDPGDFAATGKGEPEVAVLAHRDREWLGASKDRGGLGSNATSREDECGDTAREVETELTRGGREACNGRFDKMKINFHASKRYANGSRIAKYNGLRGCYL